MLYCVPRSWGTGHGSILVLTDYRLQWSKWACVECKPSLHLSDGKFSSCAMIKIGQGVCEEI